VTDKIEWIRLKEWRARNPNTIGRDVLYRGIKDGSIPHLKPGKKNLLVPADLLDRMWRKDDNH